MPCIFDLNLFAYDHLPHALWMRSEYKFCEHNSYISPNILATSLALLLLLHTYEYTCTCTAVTLRAHAKGAEEKRTSYRRSHSPSQVGELADARRSWSPQTLRQATFLHQCMCCRCPYSSTLGIGAYYYIGVSGRIVA